MISVIIVAGGSGTRLSNTQKKQYIKLAGKEIISYAIETFNNLDIIDEIIVVCGDKEIEFVQEKICLPYDKVKKVVAGGKERQDSVYNALKVLNSSTDYVLIHDGVRPFVDKTDILTAINKMKQTNACVLAVPVKDTIKKCDVNTGEITETLNRNLLFSIQTPQCFKKNLIIRAHENAKEKNIFATDDSTLVELLGEKVFIVNGSYNNIKITTIEDLAFGEKILKQV